MNKDYKDNLKELLFIYKKNPSYRDEYYYKITKKNKNKVFMGMMEMFEEEIDNFSYDSENNISYLFAILELIPDIIGQNQFLTKTCSYKFNEIHNKIKDILHSKPSELTKEQNANYLTIKNLLTKLENTIIELDFSIPKDFDRNKEEYISYLIFNGKNLHIIHNAIEKFPHIVNTKVNDDKPLVYEVIDKYVEALNTYTSDPNLGPIDDLIYYKKVLKLLLSSPKISLNDTDKQDICNRLQNELKNFKCDVIRQKEKYTYFINSMIMLIMGETETNSKDNLNYEYEIHENFNAAHVVEAKHIYILNKDIKAPRKKRKIYTFDGEGAKEIDDGLSITHDDGIYHLGVHIANPIKYIGTNSLLYDEAKKRTRTLYFDNDFIPMFPIELSGDLMSLNEGKPRYAINHFFDIDERTGELLKYTITDDPIKVAKNLTYEDFNRDIIKGSDDETYYETLVNLCNISPILAKVYNEEAMYKEFHSDSAKSLSTSVVANCMIYTNHNLPKWFDERGLPFPFRCHIMNPQEAKAIEEITTRMKLRDPNNQNKDYIRDLELIKGLYPRAFYSYKNVGHLGLGTDEYSHSTSPLRRFADDLAIECIYKFMLDEYTREDIELYTEYIQMVTEEINAKRVTLDSYEMERMHVR